MPNHKIISAAYGTQLIKGGFVVRPAHKRYVMIAAMLNAIQIKSLGYNK